MGVFDEAKGKLTELAGDVTNDPELQRKGQAQADPELDADDADDQGAAEPTQ